MAHPLWNSLIPQATHSQLPVKHMVVAAASIHEATEFAPNQVERCRTLFMRHYHEAVALLTQVGSPPSTEIVLMSCLLFIACENFQGSTLAGLLHIYSGLNIIKDWKAASHNGTIHNGFATTLIENYIDPIFTRLEAQTSVYRSNLQSKSLYSTNAKLFREKPNVPSSFRDLYAARDTLDDIMMRIFWSLYYDENKSLDVSATICGFQVLLEQWHRPLEDYTASLDCQNSLEARTALGLEVHRHILAMTLDGFLFETETEYDKYDDDFRSILRQCDSIIKFRETGPTDNWSEYQNRMSLFVFDLGLIPPLFFIACHCRDPAVRRKAIRLMRYLHRKEGSWDTCSAAKLAEGVMMIEERGLTLIRHCADVTELSRIRALGASIHPMNLSKVILRYTRSPYLNEEEEQIDWATLTGGTLATLTVRVRGPPASYFGDITRVPVS